MVDGVSRNPGDGLDLSELELGRDDFPTVSPPVRIRSPPRRSSPVAPASTLQTPNPIPNRAKSCRRP